MAPEDVFRLMPREAFERPEISDEEGKAVFALDERLRWKSHQQSSPSLTECVASVASVASFRMVARLLSALTAGVFVADDDSLACVEGLSERYGRGIESLGSVF